MDQVMEKVVPSFVCSFVSVVRSVPKVLKSKLNKTLTAPLDRTGHKLLLARDLKVRTTFTVKHNKQYLMKILLNNFYLNGHP